MDRVSLLLTGFRLVQIRTSVVGRQAHADMQTGFRLVQICTSVVANYSCLDCKHRFRLVQTRTSVVGQSWQNNQWYSVIKHQTYLIDTLIHIYIIPFSDTNVNRKWLFYIKHFYHLPSVVISSHSPISLTAAIAQSSTATMIAVRIVFPIFITSCPLFCIHYTTLSSSTKV